MKKHIFYLAILLTLFSSCKEEYVGQFPVDNVPPKNVTNVQVENISGGAILRYNLPVEDDLLCVTARFTLPNGTVQEISSSAYSSSITLKGYGKAQKSTVELFTVDKSYNKSAPLKIEIEPKDSPVYEVKKSFKYEVDFGGLNFYWENPEMETIVLGVMVKDVDGRYKHIETIYAEEASASRTLRGMDSIPYNFAFYFRDTYNNYTDTIYDVLTPRYEEEIDKARFMELPISSNFKQQGYGGSSMPKMWDKIINVENNVNYLTSSKTPSVPVYFCFDMGQKVEVTRFKLWTRQSPTTNFICQLHHARAFEVWGTNDAAAARSPDNWTGFELMGTFRSTRPSGELAAATVVPLSSAEMEYFLAGEEFKFPQGVPAFRYWKFNILSTWGGAGTDGNTNAVFFGEISIWGIPRK